MTDNQQSIKRQKTVEKNQVIVGIIK